MEPDTYRLTFDGPGIREEVTFQADSIAEAARIADEYRELLGWLGGDGTADDPAAAPPVEVRIEPIAQPATAALA